MQPTALDHVIPEGPEKSWPRASELCNVSSESLPLAFAVHATARDAVLRIVLALDVDRRAYFLIVVFGNALAI